MSKKLKSSTDNQWTSVPEEYVENSTKNDKKNKSETNNQWTSTAKNKFTNK